MTNLDLLIKENLNGMLLCKKTSKGRYILVTLKDNKEYEVEYLVKDVGYKMTEDTFNLLKAIEDTTPGKTIDKAKWESGIVNQMYLKGYFEGLPLDEPIKNLLDNADMRGRH